MINEIEFVSTDVASIEANIITVYEGFAERQLAPGDPIKLFLQAIASIIVQQRTLINFTGNQNLLANATSEYLEGLAEFYSKTREDAKAAKTTIKVTLSAPQAQDLLIAAGTRVTPNGELNFSTTELLTIVAGNLTGEVAAECLTKGTVGNDWQIGQINKLVDPVAYVLSVENTTVSSGGAEVESDDDFRERVRTSPESYSTAGPTGGYKYWAKTADASIIDVSVTSPSAGSVLILPLCDDGIPGAEVLSAVEAVCNDREKRPLTDNVTVSAPTSINYNITLTYYIDTENSAKAADIQTAVNSAVDDFIIWQRSKLGRAITPSDLIAKIINVGAKRVTVTAPVYTAINSSEVAIANTPTITYGGLEDA